MKTPVAYDAGVADFCQEGNMNRGTMIDIIQDNTKCSRVDAEKTVDQLGLEIRDALCRGDDVKWTNLFNLKVGATKETTRRNPRTGEDVQVPAGRRVYFKVAKALKDAVNVLPF
jgi:DNA-binding protein HU-beta